MVGLAKRNGLLILRLLAHASPFNSYGMVASDAAAALV